MPNKEILRFDIETASEVFTEEEWFKYPKRHLWENSMEEKEKPQTLQYYRNNCGIYAEFSKVVCISVMIE
jgi:hypothetical protein